MEAWQLTSCVELDAVFRILIAAAIGGLIGYERERAQKPAGLRTHLLVCTGAALFTVSSIYGFGIRSDPSRVAAAIVVGIGFLGAGTIFRGEEVIIGLTTAATIWATAAIGLAIGTGLYLIAIVTAIVAFIALRFPRSKSDVN